jgi:hypothetical protein
MLDVFPSIGEAPLERVQYVHVRIIFRFGPTSFVVLADEDDDSVVLWMANTHTLNMTQETDVSHLKVWEPFIGKPFGWGYIVLNQQGYCDGLLLSFGDIRPQILLQVLASLIVVSTISEVRPQSGTGNG